MPWIGFGNATLANEEALRAGDRVLCPACGCSVVVHDCMEDGEPTTVARLLRDLCDGAGAGHGQVLPRSPGRPRPRDILLWIKCPCEGKMSIVGIAGKLVQDVRPDCASSRSEESPKPAEDKP